MTPPRKKLGARKPVMVWVRATANLYRHPRGSVFEVDATDPQIQKALEDGWLVPIGDADEPAPNE